MYGRCLHSCMLSSTCCWTHAAAAWEEAAMDEETQSIQSQHCPLVVEVWTAAICRDTQTDAKILFIRSHKEHVLMDVNRVNPFFI